MSSILVLLFCFCARISAGLPLGQPTNVIQGPQEKLDREVIAVSPNVTSQDVADNDVSFLTGDDLTEFPVSNATAEGNSRQARQWAGLVGMATKFFEKFPFREISNVWGGIKTVFGSDAEFEKRTNKGLEQSRDTINLLDTVINAGNHHKLDDLVLSMAKVQQATAVDASESVVMDKELHAIENQSFMQLVIVGSGIVILVIFGGVLLYRQK